MKENLHLTEVPPKNTEKHYTQYKSYYMDSNQGSGIYSVTCQVGRNMYSLCQNIKTFFPGTEEVPPPA